MHNPRAPKRPDSTTVFVSLSLALLVLFSYLNAVSLPSTRLLKKALPAQNPDASPISATKTEYPLTLKKLIVFSTTRNVSAFAGDPAQSVLLVDKRELSNRMENGHSYKDELLKWLAASAKPNMDIEVTCFLPNVPTPAADFVSNLQKLQSECATFADLSTQTLLDKKIKFLAQRVPAKVSEKLLERAVSETNAMLITLTRSTPLI